MKKKLNFDSHYLTGIFEGCGDISYLSGEKNPRFSITTHSKNLPWLLKVQENLTDGNSYGFISKKAKEKALVLTISNKEGLYLIGKKLNGKFKTPKKEVFDLLLNWLSGTYVDEPVFIPLPLDYCFLNAWASGFIDAQGDFYIRCSEPKISSGKLPRIGASFTLEQRLTTGTGLSYKFFFIQLNLFFPGSKVYISTKKNGKRYCNLTMNSERATNRLVDYLEEYPLSTSKYLDYLDWREVVGLIIYKEHLKKENIASIKYLKSSLNNSRKLLTWNHL